MKEFKGVEDMEVIKPRTKEDLDTEKLEAEYNECISKMNDLQYKAMELHLEHKANPSVDLQIERDLNSEIKRLERKGEEIKQMIMGKEIKQNEEWEQDMLVHKHVKENFMPDNIRLGLRNKKK